MLFLCSSKTLFIALALLTASAVSGDDGRARCSYNGYMYPDSNECECFQCYNGTDCSNLIPIEECQLDTTDADPEMLHEYWEQHTDLGTADVASDYRNGYQNIDTTDVLSDQVPLVRALGDSIRALHQQTGNVLDPAAYTIVLGGGATNLVVASQYAVSRIAQERGGVKNVGIYARPPFWFHFRSLGKLPLGYGTWNESLEQDPSQVVEIVTYPSNPDGAFPNSTYNTSYLIYDMVYYWPLWLDPELVTPVSHDVMLFSLSKLSGHGANRGGWALVKDPKVAQYMQDWITLTQLYPNGVESIYRMLNIIKGMVSTNLEFFTTNRARILSRWSALLQVTAQSDRFSIQSRPGYCFAWLQCERQQDLPCAQTLENAGLISQPGPRFGSSPALVRIDLTNRDQIFALLLKKLALLVAQ